MRNKRPDVDDRVVDVFGNLSPIASRTSSVLALMSFAAA